MASPRRKRFNKLLVLRQRELAQKHAAAAKARTAMNTSSLALETCQGELRQAAHHWRANPSEVRAAATYLEAGAWLQKKVQGVEKALTSLELSQERVRLTMLDVVRAENEKRKIESLLQRITEEEALAAAREEQKDQDEIASRQVRNSRFSK